MMLSRSIELANKSLLPQYHQLASVSTYSLKTHLQGSARLCEHGFGCLNMVSAFALVGETSFQIKLCLFISKAITLQHFLWHRPL